MATARAARISETKRATRTATDAPADLRNDSRHGTPTRLLDISRYGFRIEICGLAPDSIVWLRLPEADPRAARVVWSDDSATGCVFSEMLDVELFRRTIRSGCDQAMVITGPWKPTAA